MDRIILMEQRNSYKGIYLIIIKYMRYCSLLCTDTNISRVPTVRDKSDPITAGF